MKQFENILQRIKDNDTTLTEVDLSYSRLFNQDILTLADALKSNNYVKKLNIAGNRAYESGAKALSKTNIEELNISYNHIGNAGAVHFTTNNKIKALNVSFNFIDDYGAIALSHNDTIQELDVSHNVIGTLGGKALMRMGIKIKKEGNEFGKIPSSSVESPTLEPISKRTKIIA